MPGNGVRIEAVVTRFEPLEFRSVYFSSVTCCTIATLAIKGLIRHTLVVTETGNDGIGLEEHILCLVQQHNEVNSNFLCFARCQLQTDQIHIVVVK